MNYEQFKHQNKSVFLVDMTKELDYHFSELVKSAITKQLNLKNKIWIIVNKKWYAPWIICTKCGYIPHCEKCSVPISYHQLQNWQLIWLCHICKMQYNFSTICENCWENTVKTYWIWTQQIAQRIENEYKTTTLIVDSDHTNSPTKILKLSEEFNKKKPDVVIWTSLLCQPIKNYPLDMMIFLNADLWLNIPDFNVWEKNFHLLYECFLKYECKNFIVQTFNPWHYSIRNACRMNESLFWEEENQFRKMNKYPPFSELCVILYKNEIEEKVFNKVDQLYKELLYLAQKYQMQNIEIYSTPPLIYKMFWKYRYNIILKWNGVRNFMDIVYTKLNLNAKWFKINWDADSIV